MSQGENTKECGSEFCLEHSGLAGKINMVLWLIAGNGSLLICILGILISTSSVNAIQTEKLIALDKRIEDIELKIRTVDTRIDQINMAEHKEKF